MNRFTAAAMLNALNEAKKYQWTAKDAIKQLEDKILDGTPSKGEIIDFTQTARCALGSLGVQLRGIEVYMEDLKA